MFVQRYSAADMKPTTKGLVIGAKARRNTKSGSAKVDQTYHRYVYHSRCKCKESWVTKCEYHTLLTYFRSQRYSETSTTAAVDVLNSSISSPSPAKINTHQISGGDTKKKKKIIASSAISTPDKMTPADPHFDFPSETNERCFAVAATAAAAAAAAYIKCQNKSACLNFE